MNDPSIGTNIDKLAQINSNYMAESNQKCIDYKYDNMIFDLRNVSILSGASYGSMIF